MAGKETDVDKQMIDQHPITPPAELVDQWWGEVGEVGSAGFRIALHIATQAARWGADYELKACCEWLCAVDRWKTVASRLRSARRLKQPNLKKQAFGALYAIATGTDDSREFYQDIETIKAALEALPDS